jgi:hypothetical protein
VTSRKGYKILTIGVLTCRIYTHHCILQPRVTPNLITRGLAFSLANLSGQFKTQHFHHVAPPLALSPQPPTLVGRTSHRLKCIPLISPTAGTTCAVGPRIPLHVTHRSPPIRSPSGTLARCAHLAYRCGQSPESGFMRLISWPPRLLIASVSFVARGMSIQVRVAWVGLPSSATIIAAGL